MKILATRALGNGLYAVLDGDGEALSANDRLQVDGWATLRVKHAGPFPVCEITRMQTGVNAGVLVGMEAERGNTE